jgi:hypothetical protein
VVVILIFVNKRNTSPGVQRERKLSDNQSGVLQTCSLEKIMQNLICKAGGFINSVEFKEPPKDPPKPKDKPAPLKVEPTPPKPVLDNSCCTVFFNFWIWVLR